MTSTTLTYPLILVSVPHQHLPTAEVVESESDLIRLADRAADASGVGSAVEYMDLGEDRTAEDALAYLAEDMHALDVWTRATVGGLAHPHDHQSPAWTSADRQRPRDHGQPQRTTLAIRHAIELGWIGGRGECADCGCGGPICATPDGEIEFGGYLFAARRDRGERVLVGSKHAGGDAVCDECEDARDEASEVIA